MIFTNLKPIRRYSDVIRYRRLRFLLVLVGAKKNLDKPRNASRKKETTGKFWRERYGAIANARPDWKNVTSDEKLMENKLSAESRWID